MKIYLEDGITEVENPDLTLGYLANKEKTIHHDAIAEVKKVSHYETIAEYPNGGKDVEEVIDTAPVAAKDAYDEIEQYQIYTKYTAAELQQRKDDEEIAALKAKLLATDYEAIKFAEGILSAEDYAATKTERETWRARINELQATDPAAAKDTEVKITDTTEEKNDTSSTTK